jgi:2,4-dienoyl-CoA reductase-like NADH-dependent reductase (Old Yellow Enzyme family)
MAEALQEAGVDYISVSQGCYGSTMRVFPEGEGTVTDDAAAIRKEVSVPVMCPNFQDPEKAAGAIADGSVDMVALSRALLADPLWGQKVREGRAEEIQPCIRCHQCLRAVLVDHLPVRCSVNPELGFERFNPRWFPKPGGPVNQ